MSNKTADKKEAKEELAESKPGAIPAPAATHMEIKGAEFSGKNPTRLFQTGPFEKTWLNKAEATEKGFYWKD